MAIVAGALPSSTLQTRVISADEFVIIAPHGRSRCHFGSG